MKLKGFQKEYQGLSETSVLESRKLYGENRFEKKEKESMIHKILKTFLEPMFFLLLVTSTIYFLLGEVQDGIIMLCFVVFVLGIDIFQEWRTDRALEALKTLTSLKTKVLRGTKLLELESEEIVVGDIVLLEEGDRVSFDGSIEECYGLGLNESTLTGESEIVMKQLESEDLPFRRDRVYAGTIVVSGSAIVRVIAVGVHTEYGKIGQDLNQIKEHKTPLQQQTDRLIRVCAWISFGFCVSVVLVTFFLNTDGTIWNRLSEAVLSGVTVAMATIPEEFPVVLTVFLAMGAWRLVKQNALIRKMPSVEILGAVSVLCVDKTGTLTENQMTVKDFYLHHQTEQELIQTAVLASETDPFDPMEQALVQYQAKWGEFHNPYTFVHDYAFHSENKRMGHLWKQDDYYLAVKGAYEVLAPLCSLSLEEQAKITDQIEQFSREGYRVLAVAGTNTKEQLETLEEYSLTFLGLIAFVDPPRKEVIPAILEANRAGIRVVMITGDSKETACSIADKIGLPSLDVLSGPELEQMTKEEIQERAKTVSVYARVYPRHKRLIVEALQANGEIVAMTGDGVNDAPALKQADIGIAMGKRGTEVVKEAADFVLLDDNFTTIIKSVANGRRIYDNIKKAIVYILIIHIPIAFCSLLIPLLQLEPLLLPIHIVFLELIIDPTSSIVFERQPLEQGAMNCPPRKLTDSLMSRSMVIRSVIQGLVIFATVFLSYLILIKTGSSYEVAMTFSFTVLILSNLMVVSVISSKKNGFSNLLASWKDPVIASIQAIILVGLGVLIYSPWAHHLMKTSSLSLPMLALSFVLAIVGTYWMEFVKWFEKR